MKKAKLEKFLSFLWVTVKEKPGPNKVEKSFEETKKNFSCPRATRVLGTTSQIFYNCLGSREIRGREIG